MKTTTQTQRVLGSVVAAAFICLGVACRPTGIPRPLTNMEHAENSPHNELSGLYEGALPGVATRRNRGQAQ